METQKPLKVLVVDDEEDFRLYVRRTLELAGYDVAAAGTLAQARRTLAEEPSIHLILADLHLPDGSGLDLIKEARRRDPLSEGIVLTGHGSVDSAVESLREGAYDYIVKPCEPDSLVAAVRRGASHSALKRALLEKTAQLETLKTQLDDKSRMLQNVSHELKNPLSVVYGYAAFLLKQGHEAAPEDVKKSLQSIHNNAERLNRLLEDLLEASRLSGRKIELSRERLDAAKLAEEAVTNHGLEAQHRGVSLKLSAEAGAFVFADAKRVQQILSNLIVNALKFTPSGGRVTVSVAPAEGFARFTVKDTGVGIAPEDLAHLFERFYQAESTRRAHHGLGLGLDICKGLVELHGGHIWAESTPGQGAAFHFTLPLAVPAKGGTGKVTHA